MTFDHWRATNVLLSTIGDGTENNNSTVRVADVSGRQLLVFVEQQLKVGSAVKLTLQGNTILGEVVGTHFLSGTKHYVIVTEHMLSSTPRQGPKTRDFEAATRQTYAPDPLAVLLRGIRESPVFSTPATPSFQLRVRQLEESLGKQQPSQVAAAAVQVMAKFRDDTFNHVEGRFRVVNRTLDMMSIMLAEAADEDERLARVRVELASIQQDLAAYWPQLS